MLTWRGGLQIPECLQVNCCGCGSIVADSDHTVWLSWSAQVLSNIILAPSAPPLKLLQQA